MNEIIPIVYNSGAYGTYLYYILDTHSNKGENINGENPIFTAAGECIYKRGSGKVMWPEYAIAKWRTFINKSSHRTFFRFHPKTSKDDSILDNINEMLLTVDSLIFLYPDNDTILLNINNIISKKGTGRGNLKDIDNILETIRNNWAECSFISKFEDIPTWVLREYLSLCFFSAWYDEVEFDIRNKLPDSVVVITLSELLYSFNNVLDRLCARFNLEILEKTQVNTIHNKMLSCQEHLKKDAICKNILNHIQTNTFYKWDTLSLLDEAYLQFKLQELGFDIKCYNLNLFPSDTSKLSKLLTPCNSVINV